MLALGALIGAGAVKQVMSPHVDGARGSTPERRSTCDSVGKLTACVTKARVRSSVSDFATTTTAGKNAAFLLVYVSVQNDGNDVKHVNTLDFKLRGGGRTWSPDFDAQWATIVGGERTWGPYDDVQPGTSSGGWIGYYIPRDAIGDVYLEFKPGMVRTADMAIPGVGDTEAACTAPTGESGVCVDVAACTGKHYAGRCEGAASVQCCVR